MLIAFSAASLGFASSLNPDEVVTTFEQALAFGMKMKCDGLHDSPTYAGDLMNTFRMHDMGHGKPTEHSEAEFAKHMSSVGEEKIKALDKCMKESDELSNNRRELYYDTDGRSFYYGEEETTCPYPWHVHPHALLLQSSHIFAQMIVYYLCANWVCEGLISPARPAAVRL